jgi:hypothetical protein
MAIGVLLTLWGSKSRPALLTWVIGEVVPGLVEVEAAVPRLSPAVR